MPNGERFILTVLGNDHPGNIHRISGCLARRGVNIVDLHARADGPVFSLVMEAFLPHDLSPGVVRADLEGFGRDLGLEAFVQHENIFTRHQRAHAPSASALPPTPGRGGRPALRVEAVQDRGDRINPHWLAVAGDEPARSSLGFHPSLQHNELTPFPQKMN